MSDPTPPPAPLSPEELDEWRAMPDRDAHHARGRCFATIDSLARRVASLEAVERAARRMKLANDALVAYYADDSIPPDLDWSNRTQLDWNEAESDLYAAVDSTAAALDAARTTEEEK